MTVELMKSPHVRALVVIWVICCSAASGWAAERAWQKGTWRDVQVKRPKVVFGMSPNTPTGTPRTSPPAAQEVRTYVIETDTSRLSFGKTRPWTRRGSMCWWVSRSSSRLRRRTVWIKDLDGREHKLSLVKETKK